ncbi:unnamed protein product [Medioppia subpectinata]|uniref:Nose resistant-to-fluoxetine protein N-terminal domain-containing protein n=1 Tax=Medioppia subpectinata TaxID=1979941 RepID=A0A7R9L3M5_9ACAR|nr:unnamed protein product [Medioppia subpectinata]CAG2113800.1 unnamed protein product [Medioppia subpectinata]
MKSDDYDTSAQETNTNEPLNKTDSESDDDYEDNRCSEDEIIDKMIDIMTPEDYAEGKATVRYNTNTIRETVAAVSRLGILDAQPSFQMTVTELGGPSIGNYDQCLSIVSTEEVDQPVIKGQYCAMDTNFLLDVKKEDIEGGDDLETIFNKSIVAKNLITGLIGAFVPIVISHMKVISGFCLPTTCRPEDLSDAINEIMYPITRLPIKFQNDCEYRDKPIKLDKQQMIAILIFATLTLMIQNVIENVNKDMIVSPIRPPKYLRLLPMIVAGEKDRFGLVSKLLYQTHVMIGGTRLPTSNSMHCLRWHSSRSTKCPDLVFSGMSSYWRSEYPFLSFCASVSLFLTFMRDFPQTLLLLT